MSTSKKKSTMLGMLTLGMLAASLMIGSDVYASAIQAHPPEVIFAASCATCHGSTGQGGVTWVKDGPGDNRRAPNLSGLDRRYVVSKVRSGAKNGAMPAFGREEITDAELNALANWIQAGGSDSDVSDGLEAPAPGTGTEVVLNILDADPWFNEGSGGVSSDKRRVELQAAADYLKVTNTGRTWHTFTNAAKAKDSGFIGYAGNYNIDAGDLGDMGYYYADQTTGLASGCVRYLCKMHPYMQVEVCTSGNLPVGPTAALGLTRAHKNRLIGTPTFYASGGIGEVWVTTQSQDNPGEDTVSLDPNNGNKSVVGMDGAYQVIDATTFTAVLPSGLKNVGNNPHNAWPIDVNGDGIAEEVLSANWHDNTVTLMDANPLNRVVLNEKRVGATIAHAMAQPSLTSERFFVTQMGGRGIHELDLADLRAGLDPNLGGPISGATGPHGLWFCGNGKYILTADTFGNSATWYNIDDRSSTTAGSNGTAPLAPAIAEGINFIPDGDACDRGFTNNALTADLSLYDMDGDSITRNTSYVHARKKTSAYTNGAGNLALRMVPGDPIYSDPVVAVAGETIDQASWVHLPIQTPVSPSDSTHPRYVVTANKASFNVSVTELDSSGDPVAVYNFPAGLGAHGVTYGEKDVCDSGPTDICYYAYVTNTLEDYVSVYDLEKIGTVMGAAGSALIAETVYVEGGAIAALLALDPGIPTVCDAFVGAPGALDCGGGVMGAGTYFASNVPIGVLCPDCRSGVHVADIPLSLTTGEPLAYGTTAALGVDVSNDGGLLPAVDGATAKYTYLKEEVWLDTMTTACVLDTLGFFAALGDVPGAGLFNNCNNIPYEDPTTWIPPGAGCTYRDVDSSGTYTTGDLWEFPCDFTPATGPAGPGPLVESEIGNLNTAVTLDLELGINTGGQGIVGVPAATPWP